MTEVTHLSKGEMTMNKLCQKNDKQLKVIYYIILVVLFVWTLFSFYVYYTLSPLVKTEVHSPDIEKIEYENHEYLIFRQNEYSSSVIHNPDCPCRKWMFAK